MNRFLIILCVFLILPSLGFAALADESVAYWKLDGNTSDSVSTRDLTNDGATYGAGYGIINGGYYFVTNDKMYRADDDIFSPASGDVSFSIWVYPLDTTTRKMLFAKGASSNYEYIFEIYNNVIRCIYWNSGGGNVLSQLGTTTVTANTWHHIVISVTNGASGSSKIFLDGNLESSESLDTTSMSNGNAQFQIGAFSTSSSPMNGYLDEIGIFNTPLNLTNAQTIYNSGTGLSYPFTPSGWTGTFLGVTNPSSALDVAVANIDNIMGVSSG